MKIVLSTDEIKHILDTYVKNVLQYSPKDNVVELIADDTGLTAEFEVALDGNKVNKV
jgi:signal transduction histidine kinase